MYGPILFIFSAGIEDEGNKMKMIKVKVIVVRCVNDKMPIK